MNLTQQLKKLLQEENLLWYDIAVTSFEIVRSLEWQKRGYSSIKEYVQKEFEPLGLSYQMFMYRAKMGEAIYKYDLQKEKLNELGWTKFKEMASYLMMEEIEDEEIDELIDKAKEVSSREFSAFIRERKYSLVGSESTPTFDIRVRFIGDQVAIIRDALKLATEFAQSDNLAVVLLYIFTDFLMNHSNDNEVIKRIREEITSLAMQKKKIVSGPKTLKKLVQR